MSVSESKQFKSVQRKYRTYCGLKFDVPENVDPMPPLVKQTALLFTGIQKHDPKAIICAFNDFLPTHSIQTPKDIPYSYILYKDFFFWCTV